MATPDLVLISGAGPAGLVAGLALRKNGLNVRIIDRELKPRPGERGAGVTPRSLELHKILGTLPDILEIAGPLPTMREHDAKDPYKVVLTFDLVAKSQANPNAPWRNYVTIGQNHHERILREHLAQYGTPVEFGSELRTFRQSKNSVTAEVLKRTAAGQEIIEKVEVAWLIGADGARSVVRKTLGVSFLGETRNDRQTVIADLKTHSPPSEFWNIWGNRETKFVVQRPSTQEPDVVSLLLMGKFDVDRVIRDPEFLVNELYSIINRQDIKFGEVIWSSKYRPNIRMVDKLRVGRVFLTGDAAHCHTPAGGQGLNSSIQDSFNLAWKLALVHKGVANPSLLDTYQEERLPVIAQMLNKTTKLLKYTFETATQPTEAEMRKDMIQLGVNYRGSSLLCYDPSKGDAAFVKGVGYNRSSETDALPGDRAPDAPALMPLGEKASASSLFDVFSPICHTILVFYDTKTACGAVGCIAEALRGQPSNTVQGILLVHGENPDLVVNTNFNLDLTLVDSEGHAFRGYHVQGPSENVNFQAPLVIIVRPDGVIGARFRGCEGIIRYFGGIFHGSLRPKL